MNPYEIFINRLDSFGVFQILSEGNVYDFVKRNYPLIKSDSSELVSFVPYNYTSYRDFFMYSIFLLSYSYFEAFLYDVAFLCLKSKPNLYEGFSQMDHVSDEKIEELLSDKAFRFENMKSFLTKNLKLKYDDKKNITLLAHLTRNCLLHNNSKVSKKMNKNFPEAPLDKKMFMDNNALNMSGTFARKFAKTLYEDAVKKYEIDKLVKSDSNASFKLLRL
jgi:hypothetical protein